MKNLLFGMFCVSAMALMLFVAPVSCEAQSLNIGIVVSPSTLNIGSQGEYVTVHADIDYGLVIGATVTLNGIEVSFTKADNQGDFVAKFSIDQVKDIVEPGTAVLTLSGYTSDGSSFSGTSTVRVVDISGKK